MARLGTLGVRGRAVRVLALLLLSGQALAAGPTYNTGGSRLFDLQLFRPAIDTKGYITTNASRVLGLWDFSIGLIGTVANGPLRRARCLSEPGEEEAFGIGQAGGQLVLARHSYRIQIAQHCARSLAADIVREQVLELAEFACRTAVERRNLVHCEAVALLRTA